MTRYRDNNNVITRYYYGPESIGQNVNTCVHLSSLKHARYPGHVL